MKHHTLKECKGRHCRCMKSDCNNYHFSSCELCKQKFIEKPFLDVSCPRCGAIPQHGHFCNDMHTTGKEHVKTLPVEEKLYTQWDMDNEYARGFNDGANGDLSQTIT